MPSPTLVRHVRLPLLVLTAVLGASAAVAPLPTFHAHAEAPAKPQPRAALLPKLDQYTKPLASAFVTIPEERKQALDKLALFVRSKRSAGEKAKLVFICTHNSRRSHISQLWALAAAARHGIENVEAYSGGVEVTAFNPRAVAALERAGFKIEKPQGENPHYRVSYAKNRAAVESFSKKYDDATNPRDGFAAVMTCSQADKSCPSIQGASLRVALPFEDPKLSDGKPEEAATYDQRTKQIATEMFYLFSRVEASKS